LKIESGKLKVESGPDEANLIWILTSLASSEKMENEMGAIDN